MITTVTLNTSIDKAYELSEPLEVGKVQRVKRCVDFAGGKGLNAARAVRTCGEDVVATGFVGGNNGRLLCHLLALDGVEERFVRVRSETRCCVNVLDPDGRSTEFLEPGREVTRLDVTVLLERISQLAAQSKVVTINGSVPPGFGDEDYAALVAAVKDAGTHVLVDASGELLRLAVGMLPTLVKPNADEISQILGHPVRGPEEAALAARELHGRGIAEVVVSLGKDGAVMSSDAGTFLGRAPKISVVNPVGAGDTMVGALAVAMARGQDPASQLRFAMACASANCLSASTGHFDMEDARRLFRDVSLERLD